MANGRANKTGVPANVKAGVEKLSGYDLANVRINTHSAQPSQVKAHAYAQGNQVHVARGQERHLGHEAAHVVQQKQGRVQATTQFGALENKGRK